MKCPYCDVELEKGICHQCGFDIENRRLTQEVACVRALLERILRTMDESLFVDYQMEKFGQIKYDKKILVDENRGEEK